MLAGADMARKLKGTLHLITAADCFGMDMNVPHLQRLLEAPFGMRQIEIMDYVFAQIQLAKAQAIH